MVATKPEINLASELRRLATAKRRGPGGQTSLERPQPGVNFLEKNLSTIYTTEYCVRGNTFS